MEACEWAEIGGAVDGTDEATRKTSEERMEGSMIPCYGAV